MASKTVLITGASSGIGAELALQLAREGGVHLALAARRRDRLEEVARRIKDETGLDAFVHPADMTQPSQVAFLVEAVRNRFGRLDVLVNNAGVLFMQPFLEMPVGDMQHLFNTNLWGPLHAVRAAAPVMAGQGGGHILQALEAALWAFNASESYRDGALAAANLGRDSDVVSAVYGQLAGAYHGVSAIPGIWRNSLMRQEVILDVADRLLTHALVTLGD